jgi:hypothetical protein
MESLTMLVTFKTTRQESGTPADSEPIYLGGVQFYTDAATARAQSHICRTLSFQTAVFIKSAVAGFTACDRSRVGGDTELAKHLAAP